VPSAWAKKGKMKFFGSKKGMAATSPSRVEISAPFGAGIMEPLIKIRILFTTPPIKRPAITARIFLKMGFIFFVFTETNL
jgi:hypothetical protein